MAKSKAKKAVKAKAVKPKAKPVAKSNKKTVAPKPDKKAKKAPVKPVKVSKPAAKPAVKNNVAPKVQAAPAKPAKAEKVKQAEPVAKPAKVAAPPPVKGKVKEKPVLSPELAALPKLPSHIHLKKQKGKLAPGEKRIVKTEVITHHVISDKPIDPEKKAKAEPKGKYQMEFIIRCPVTLLYDFISTPSGLQEWFADDVNLKNDMYSFNWDGQVQQAKLLNAKIDNYLRFRWIDKPEGTYVEFRLLQDELTGEVSLVVTDFGDSEDDIITNRRLWESQIQRLIKVMGAY
jgi:uncharacterized protein YndB with AHSA1/START domain